MASVTRDEARTYYEDFSLAVGIRDWLATNPRHEQLRILVDEILTGRRGLRILDVGCGAGVMTNHLRRYGDVTGVDFSGAAIAAARVFTARRFGRRPTFHAGSLEALPDDASFDVITLFDVLEHISRAERPGFLADLRTRLAEGGLVFASTPYPEFTKRRRTVGDDTLQIIDEEVELPQLVREAADAGLKLIRFQAYDVFAGSPEYQMMLFTTERSPDGEPALRTRKLERRMRWLRNGMRRRALRSAHAGRLLLAGERGAARTALLGRPPDIRS
jgi:2-polyprenyl-3-methyl-5-hydroxy-6-metoxy-1,4-benzoquinol methylase